MTVRHDGSPDGERELELPLLEVEARELAWRLATDAAGVGAFDWDLVTGELHWDARLHRLFGLVEGSFGGTIEAFEESVHPEDRARVAAALDAAIAECGELATEYRILHPDGRTRWITARGRAVPSEDGVAVRLLGAAYDTTAEQEGEARVARVLESMPTAFFGLDPEWRFTYLNEHGERLLGRSRDELVGAVIWTEFPASVGSDFEHHYRLCAASGEPVAFDAYYPAPLDAWYEVRAWPNPDGIAVYFTEVSARRRAQEHVARAARRSALMAELSERLTDTLEVGEAMAALGSIVVPTLGDWCVATLVHDPGHEGRLPALRDVGAWHAVDDRQDLVARFAEIRLDHLADASFLPTVMAAHEPLVTDRATEVLRELFTDEARSIIEELRPEHAVVISLWGRHRVVGLLTLFRDEDRGPFGDDDVETLLEVAQRAGLALDNTRLFAEQRELAAGLQRSMLTAPPQPDHLEIVVRYEAAAETAQVGGDWHDAFMQAEGATVLVIGDVVGHDTAAAAAMGQVRSMLRGIAVHSGLGPAALLQGVDRALETLQVETTATAVVARIEQTPEELAARQTRLRWSNAGHPPPALITPDGTVQLLGADAEPDLLLGIGPQVERTEHEVVVERDSTVLLFTDGLVERRGELLDDGLARLRRELTRLAAEDFTLDELCDRLLSRMVPSLREDDVALVAVRLHPQDQPRPVEAGPGLVPDAVDPQAPYARGRLLRARFAAEAASVPAVRRFVRDALTARGSTLIDDAELCAAELATNAALHSGGAFMELFVRLDADAVTITLADEGEVPPEAVTPRLPYLTDEADDETTTTGRGLGIVAVLAEWGVERTPSGKRVWARLEEGAVEREIRLPDSPAMPSSGSTRPDGDLPDGWGAVRLRGCPVALAMRADEHLDALVRELQLLAADRDNARSRQIVDRLQTLLVGSAHARSVGRLTARAAAANGADAIDVDLTLPTEVVDGLRSLGEAVRAADELCRAERLLTSPTTPEVAALRSWIASEIRQQLREGTDPEPWEDWRARTASAPD